ncbi:hypothetical protein ACIO13_35635 [Streptomyces sp. NPDC087425]|uniref:hypothetical protein n=1 Tax=Streptomyces sp. NPDC087425 TaxID=3365787 RepID=UPI003811FCC6
MTLDGLSVALRAVRLLSVDFGHLPGPHLHVSTIFPRRVELALHDSRLESLAAFEVWREALGIDPDTVKYVEQSSGCTRVLTGYGEFAGATVELTAFATVPAPAVVGGAG